MKNSGVSTVGRCAAAIAAAFWLAGAAAAPAEAQSLVERANRGLVYIATGSTLGTTVRTVEDLADVLDDGATRRIVPMVGKGSIQNLMDLKVLRGIDVTIVQTDVLDYARAQRNPPGIESVTYIAKLYNEEFHLLARGDVKTIADLAGKRVNLGLPGDGTSYTGARIFDLLKIKIQATAYDQPTALDKLRSGEIAALAFVTGKPAPLFTSLRQQEGLHLVAVPLKTELAAAYIPGRFTPEDYPNLMGSGEAVDTVAVGTVMVAANFAQDSERYRNIASFTEAFFTQFPKLLEPGHHAKWSEVNLSAELPGWRRFAPAEAWIKRNGGPAMAMSPQDLREIFARFLDERARAAGGPALSAKDKQDLFDQFQRWQEGRTR